MEGERRDKVRRKTDSCDGRFELRQNCHIRSDAGPRAKPLRVALLRVMRAAEGLRTHHIIAMTRRVNHRHRIYVRQPARDTDSERYGHGYGRIGSRSYSRDTRIRPHTNSESAALIRRKRKRRDGAEVEAGRTTR